MNLRQRVEAVFSGKVPDRAPKGEICLPKVLVQRILGGLSGNFRHDMSRILKKLNADLVFFNLDPYFQNFALSPASLEEIRPWVEEEPYYPVAMVEGVFWPSIKALGFEQACRWALKKPDEYATLLDRLLQENLENVRSYLQTGVRAIMVMDDLAGNSGTLFSPALLRRFIFPRLACMAEVIKEMGAIPLFHSDGNINGLLPDLKNAPFAGLHGLQASAGMNLLEVRKVVGEQVTLMGGFSVDYLFLQGLEQAEKEVLTLLIDDSFRCRYIFGTDGGLDNLTNPDFLLKLYELAEVV